jgi:hypothetical protein
MKPAFFAVKKNQYTTPFFDCAVAVQLRVMLSDLLGVRLGGPLDSIGKFWLSNKKNSVINIFTSATFWCLWTLRNDLCFQRLGWRGMDILLHKIAGSVLN